MNVGGKIMELTLDFIKEFTNNLGHLLGPKCEIVIHDFTQGFDHTVVHIVNGGLSGREIGGCPTNLFFEHFNTLAEDTNSLSEYYTTTEDGRIIRSSTTNLSDANGKIIAAICVNIDISDFINFKQQIGYIIGDKGRSGEGVGNEKFARNVHELMNHYLNVVEREIGKPAAEMNKQEKLRALAYLDKCGVLQISKANIKLCEFFNISKFTLYNYLEEVRKADEE